MLDTKLYAMVTAHAHDAGAKLILVGDDRQLSSIDAGGMFAVLKDRHGAAVLSEVKRQYKADERRASEMMAEGNFDAALAHLRPQGRDPLDAHTGRGPRRAGREMGAGHGGRARQIPLCVRLHQSGRRPVECRACAPSGRSAASWNGKITPSRRRTANLNLAPATGSNSPAPTGGSAVENGVTGTIEAIDGTHLAVRLSRPRGQDVINFDAANFDHFRHGYAGTVWKGQGDHARSNLPLPLRALALGPVLCRVDPAPGQNRAVRCDQHGRGFEGARQAGGAAGRNARRLDVLPARRHRAGTADDGPGNSRAVRRREISAHRRTHGAGRAAMADAAAGIPAG